MLDSSINKITLRPARSLEHFTFSLLIALWSVLPRNPHFLTAHTILINGWMLFKPTGYLSALSNKGQMRIQLAKNFNPPVNLGYQLRFSPGAARLYPYGEVPTWPYLRKNSPKIQFKQIGRRHATRNEF